MAKPSNIDTDIWDWILKTPEQKQRPLAYPVKKPVIGAPASAYGQRVVSSAKPASKQAVSPPALSPEQAVAPGKTPKVTVDPATITIDKFGQITAMQSPAAKTTQSKFPAAPGYTGNPIPDKSKGSYPASAMGTFNPSNMGPIGDLTPPSSSGFVPNGQMFAGAPKGVLMSSEEFRQYFYNQYGRWPFAEEITAQKLIYPRDPVAAQEAAGDYYDEGGGGYGGSGGGGGGSGGGGEGTVPSTLGDLAWWANADSIQPLLRDWAGWLKESVESNRGTKALANPFTFDAAAEAAGPPTGSSVPRMPGFKTNSELLQKLQSNMGLTFDETDDETTKWQKFINAIPTISPTDMETQQLLAGLRYDPNADRWWGADIKQLVHPSYL